MDPSKISLHFERLLFQDDEDDIVRFIFPVDNDASRGLMELSIEPGNADDANGKGTTVVGVDYTITDDELEVKITKEGETGVKVTSDDVQSTDGTSSLRSRSGSVQSRKVRKIKGHKSLLVEVSPVFKTMFSENWDQSEVEMDDPVDFDQCDAFRLFMAVVYELKKLDTLAVEDATRVYFYAHKYQMEPLIKKLRKVLTDRMTQGVSSKPYTVSELTESIKMAELYSLNDFKTNLDGVKLDINDKNALELYEITEDHGLKKLQEQVVKYLDKKPIDESWPFGLIVKVVERHREQLKVFRGLYSLHCTHSGYSRNFKECSTCKGSEYF